MTCMVFISSQSSGHFFDIFWPTSLPEPVRWCTPRTLTSPWWQRTALGAEGRNETGSPAFKDAKVYSLQSKTQNNHLETLHDLTRSCNYKRHISIPNAYSDGVSFQSQPIWAHHFCRETQPKDIPRCQPTYDHLKYLEKPDMSVRDLGGKFSVSKTFSPWSCKVSTQDISFLLLRY